MGKSAPTPPDPNRLMRAQTRSNIHTATANAIMNSGSQTTPFGTLTNKIQYKTVMVQGKKVRVPVTNQTVKLAPDLDRGNKASMAGSADLAQMGRRMVGDYGKTARTMTYGTDFSTDRQRVEDAIMGRMQAGMDRDRAQLEERLASQGITIGSEPYRAAMDDFNRGVNDARLGAVMQGGQEQSRLVDLERDRAAFENQTRDASLNEIMGMLNGGRAQMPSFTNGGGGGGQLPGTDVMGLMMGQYQGQLDAYNQRQQGIMGLGSSLLGAIGSAGGIAPFFAGLSDRRLKADVRRIGQRGGLNLYEFRYLWDAPGTVHRGYMAQEVEPVFPEAVIRDGEFLKLDYSKLPAVE